MKYFKAALFLLCLSAGRLSAQSDSTVQSFDIAKDDSENLNVLRQWLKWNNPGSLLVQHLTRQAEDYYQVRDAEIAKLKTKADWQNRQLKVSAKINDILGTFPEKTPLNAEVTGVIEKGDYRIEKIIFESMPGFYVTGCLYMPANISGKAPAILNVIGHDQEAFRAPLYQTINSNLAKKGMIVFAIDPPGQGEHVQYYDSSIQFSSIGYTVIEHCYFGNQCFLAGASPAKYFIWDGMRAIDYLISRKEVDPSRIGVTGFSGGGTITSYIAAVDKRVQVAIPCSWSNATRRQNETKGAVDAESVLMHSVKNGITFEDLLELRAPKPTMMTFTTRDQYLSLQGAREAFREARGAYEAFGQKENLVMVEDDFKHWMTPKIRSAMYAFFLEHFRLKGDSKEVSVEIIPEKDLHVTPTGQAVTAKGGKIIFDMNKEVVDKHITRLNESRKNNPNHLKEVVKAAKAISGYKPSSPAKLNPFINGRYRRDGYFIELLTIDGENDNYPIPLLLFTPPDNNKKHPAIIYLHPEGKITDAQNGGYIEQLVKKGYVVVAADPLGVGETKQTAARGLMDGYLGVLTGKSVVGIQAADITRAVHFVKSLDYVDASKIGAVAMDDVGLSLIHAASFDSSIKKVVLIRSLVSYSSVALNRFYKIGMTETGYGVGHPYEVNFSWGIAGVLKGYDLPDLIAGIAPRKVVMAETKNQAGEILPEAELRKELSFPLSVFNKKAPSNLQLVLNNTNLVSLVDSAFAE
ncbi:MAG: acetylxylan esterase [Chitinophagaceae bacterium]|nr:acetylxylan esterase [Chitinophagaceae bacterium]